MILADGEFFCCFVVGLGLPPLTYVVGCAVKGERFAKSIWLFVALAFVVLDLVIFAVSSTPDREISYRLLGFKRQVLPDLIGYGSAVGLLISFVMCAVIGEGITAIPYDDKAEKPGRIEAGNRERQTPGAANGRIQAAVDETDDTLRN